MEILCLFPYTVLASFSQTTFDAPLAGSFITLSKISISKIPFVL